MFQPDAMEVIDEMAQQIAGLYKENSILKSQLKAAERIATQQGEAVKESTVVDEKPKAVA